MQPTVEKNIYIHICTCIFERFLLYPYILTKHYFPWRCPACVHLVSRVHLSVRPLRRAVELGEGHQLQHVKSILPAFYILLHVLNPAAFSDYREMERGRDDNGVMRE